MFVINIRKYCPAHGYELFVKIYCNNITKNIKKCCTIKINKKQRPVRIGG